MNFAINSHFSVWIVQSVIKCDGFNLKISMRLKSNLKKRNRKEGKIKLYKKFIHFESNC